MNSHTKASKLYTNIDEYQKFHGNFATLQTYTKHCPQCLEN